MADLNIDRMLKQSILNIIYNKDNLMDDIAMWKQLTRQMFHNFPATGVFHLVNEALAQSADEDWFNNKYPNYVFKETPPQEKMERSEYQGIKNLISKKLKIIDVAKKYGLKVRGKIAVCPFHVDTKPSLSLSNEKNIFNCFGCGVKGDIIKFIGMLEDEKKRGRIKST